MWTQMTKTILSAAENTIGFNERQQRITSNEIRALSEQQKKIKLDAESTTNKQKWIKLNWQKNQILNKIKYTVKTGTNKLKMI